MMDWLSWWRGFDEADARSLDKKLEAAKTLPPGSIVEVTKRELRAMQYFGARSNGKTEVV